MKYFFPIVLMALLGGCIHTGPEIIIPKTGSPFRTWGLAPSDMKDAGMNVVNAQCRLDGQRQLAENIASFLRSRSKLYFDANKVFQDPAGAEQFVKSITVNLVALHLTGLENGDLVYDKRNKTYRLLLKIDPRHISEISKPMMKTLFQQNAEYLDKKSEEEIERLNQDISKFFLKEEVTRQ